MKLTPAMLALVLILGCTTAQTPAPAQPQSEFRNLQILPRTITRPELLATMRGFTRALGVRCNHCHVVTATEPKEQFEFPSDAKEEKRVARVMLQMVAQINDAWMERVEEAEGHEEEESTPVAGAAPQPRVVCWTCHRGHSEPEPPPPPPPDPPSGSEEE